MNDDILNPKDFASYEEYALAREMRMETDKLTDFTGQQIRLCRNVGCDGLPDEWHDDTKIENKALSWFSSMVSTLFSHKNNRVKPLRTLRKICHVKRTTLYHASSASQSTSHNQEHQGTTDTLFPSNSRRQCGKKACSCPLIQGVQIALR